jgi:hypothetical protein
MSMTFGDPIDVLVGLQRGSIPAALTQQLNQYVSGDMHPNCFPEIAIEMGNKSGSIFSKPGVV